MEQKLLVFHEKREGKVAPPFPNSRYWFREHRKRRAKPGRIPYSTFLYLLCTKYLLATGIVSQDSDSWPQVQEQLHASYSVHDVSGSMSAGFDYSMDYSLPREVRLEDGGKAGGVGKDGISRMISP